MKKPNVQVIRLLVRAREDFQSMRKRMDNRIGRKATGEQQDIDQRMMLAKDVSMFEGIADDARDQEKTIEKELKKVLKRFDIYNEYLVDVKGVGTIAAAHIVGNIDIHKAKTVSKIWQYCGYNPSKIRGKKWVSTKNPETYEPKSGKVLKRLDDRVLVLTTERIRGDKLTPGFISPFNKNLKKALFVLAGGFIKAQAPHALDYYYPYKERLEQRTDKVTHNGEKVPWKDVSDGHRDMAAKRYMLKMFLKDLYVVWRELEGLDVREPYKDEYLGKVHQN